MKVVLEQKNELLQRQIDEYKIRELNFKLFNENIFALLNDLSSERQMVDYIKLKFIALISNIFMTAK